MGQPAGSDIFRHHRRRFIGGGAALLTLAVVPPVFASRPRILSFRHLHTGETLEVEYFLDGRYRPDALAEVDRLLRDYRTGDVYPIDPGLLDILARVRTTMDSDGVFEVISGFRSAATNEMLRRKSSGVARRSLHVEGRAIDVRLSDVDTADLRRAALGIAAGGVGYYPASNFVHLDTGRVRSW